MLTAAQSLFGVAVLANLFLSRRQALLLAVLFSLQLLVPSTDGRFMFATAYLIGALGTAAFQRSARDGIHSAFRLLAHVLKGGKN